MGRIQEVFADNLRRYRKAAGLTQEKFAERAGLSVTAIRYYESQGRLPEASAIPVLAAALGVDEVALFQAETPPAQPITPADALAVLQKTIENLQKQDQPPDLIPPEWAEALKGLPHSGPEADHILNELRELARDVRAQAGESAPGAKPARRGAGKP